MWHIFTTIYLWIRPLIKWVLRKMTRLCELQRICYGEAKGANRTLQVETSLEQSRSPNVIKVLNMLDSKAESCSMNEDILFYAAFTIIQIKAINIKVHQKFTNYLGECLTKIYFYKSLMSEVEMLRNNSYDIDNNSHETQLLSLWSSLKPENMLSKRISNEWQHIGFQGDDPATDFRGMGMLGLQNLLYFSQNHSDAARHVLIRSQHPSYGYSFAIVGINITNMAYSLLFDGSAKTHFYNSSKTSDILSFHEFYCYLFFEFDILWRKERPQDIMQFGRVRQKFERNIRNLLKSPTAFLKCKFIIENI